MSLSLLVVVVLGLQTLLKQINLKHIFLSYVGTTQGNLTSTRGFSFKIKDLVSNPTDIVKSMFAAQRSLSVTFNQWQGKCDEFSFTVFDPSLLRLNSIGWWLIYFLGCLSWWLKISHFTVDRLFLLFSDLNISKSNPLTSADGPLSLTSFCHP